MRAAARFGAKLIGALGVLAVAGLVWLFVAPVSLGGVLFASAVSGASMQPAVRTGDLVVLEARHTYRTGDVVAYRNSVVSHTFLHRIVRVHDGLYSMRGDRNRWLDPGRVVRSDIAGAMVLRIPYAGGLVTWLQVPVHGAGVAAAVTALVALVGGRTVVRRRRRRRRQPVVAPPPNAGRRISKPRPPYALATAAASAAVLLLASTAGLAALLRLPATAGGRTAGYRQSASLTYSARVPPSAAYPDGAVRTGDPVYLAIVRSLNLTFGYRFASPAPARVRAGATLIAGVSDQDGWRHAVPLATSTTRRGDQVTVRATLSLAAVRRLLADVQALTGVSSATHSLTLELRGTVAGTIAGRPIRARLSDPVSMRLDDLQLQMGTPRTVAGAPVLAWHSEARRLTIAEARPRRLAQAGVGITVAAARIACAAVAVGAGLLLALTLYLRRRGPRRADDVAIAQARHGGLIVPLAVLPALPSAPLDIRDMGSLVRIARRYDAIILHHAGEQGECFLVIDGEAVFRFARAAPGWELAILDGGGTSIVPHRHLHEAPRISNSA
jgi:signal peptidase I